MPTPWSPTLPTWVSSFIRWDWRSSIPIRGAICRSGKSSSPWRVGCISAGALACWRRCPYLLVGWLWYLGMLVPVIGFVQFGGQARADRYTYLPQIGLCIALAWGGGGLCRSWPLSPLGVRRRVGVGIGSSDGVCVASDIFLARQRDPLDPCSRLYVAK